MGGTEVHSVAVKSGLGVHIPACPLPYAGPKTGDEAPVGLSHVIWKRVLKSPSQGPKED